MSRITTKPTTVLTTTAGNRSLWPAAVGFGAAAGVTTTVVAAALHAAGVSFEIAGQQIPVLGFAQLTFGFALVGLAIAAGLRRWAGDPKRAWYRTTVALTVLSFVPDLLADASLGTRLSLMTTHVIAAAIVIPAVGARFTTSDDKFLRN